MAVTDVYDCTTGNVHLLPPGQAAGYDTGPGVAWTPAQWAAHPGAVHYDQDPHAADTTADLLDIEAGAATAAEAAGWLGRARAARSAVRRPGQRDPGLYCSRSAMTGIVNDLIAAGVTSCPFVIADYSGGRARAAAEVQAASGPWPVTGRQYADCGAYDASVFANSWLADVCGHPATPLNWTEVLVDTLPTLAQGAGQHGPNQDVRTVQGCLCARGHPVTVDGEFGAETKGQVINFQHAADLALVDGIVGPATWPKLLNR